MSYPTNPTGYFNIQEPPLEPPECWRKPRMEPEEPEYDRAEDLLNGKLDRGKAASHYR